LEEEEVVVGGRRAEGGAEGTAAVATAKDELGSFFKLVDAFSSSGGYGEGKVEEVSAIKSDMEWEVIPPGLKSPLPPLPPAPKNESILKDG